MNERDIMYGGYCQSMPGNMMQYNFGYQGMPGSLMNNGMLNTFQNPNIIDLNNVNTNPMININSRLNNLENRVKMLEQKLGNTSYQDDNSMYMI